MTDTVDTGTELALFPKLNLPSVTALAEEMNKSFGTMYTRIEEEMRHLPTDMTVKANRERVASFAYSIARTKTGLDKAAAGTVESAKEIVDAVNTERRQLKNTLDILKDKARAPLDAWEEAEQAKKDRAERELHSLARFRVDCLDANSDALKIILGNLKAMDAPTEQAFGDQVAEVLNERQAVAGWLERRIGEEEKREQEAAELEQLRAEKAAREAAEAARKAEEERKAAEAAETARREEERARIAQEAAETAKREAAEKIAAAEKAAADAEAARIAAIEEARRRDIEAEERRQREAEEAEARRTREAEEASERQRQAEAQAIERERQRVAAEKAQEERERLAKERADQERAADLAHRKKLNGEAVAAIVKACELTDEQAKAVVIAIYKGQIPHVSITY